MTTTDQHPTYACPSCPCHRVNAPGVECVVCHYQRTGVIDWKARRDA